ncbi:unnamed protein product, partial [Didymodactylos carnosus]
MSTLLTIANQLIIYIGSGFFIFGNLGNVLNIIVMLRKTFNASPCSRYLLASSVSNLFFVNPVLILYIIGIINGGAPLLQNNFVWCKFTALYLHTSSLTPLVCLALGTFDRYCSTSPSASIRLFSSIKIANRTIVITVIFLTLVGLPTIFVNNIVYNQCAITSITYMRYYAYFVVPIFYVLLPLSSMIYFGIRTFINIKNIRQRQIVVRTRGKRTEEQLAIMMSIQIIIIFVSAAIYYANILYTVQTYAIVNKTIERLIIESFVSL